MTHYEAFSQLGIPVTLDKGSIKKAYQRLVCQHHPEEDPQGFMRLHQAYKTALNYAQGIRNTSDTAYTPPVPEPPEPRESQEESSYDNLFASLDSSRENRNDAAVLTCSQQAFFRELWRMKLHRLPISLNWWEKLFSSEVYLACRRDPDCLERLFDLLVKKVHSYKAFCFIVSKLWELEEWQKHTEPEDALNQKTLSCIEELQKQYSHYLNLAHASEWKHRVYPVLWYYYALPFLFKVAVSTFLLPLFSLGRTWGFLLPLLLFYILELRNRLIKRKHGLGLCRPVPRYRRGKLIHVQPIDNDLITISLIYIIIIHIGLCAVLSEILAQWI